MKKLVTKQEGKHRFSCGAQACNAPKAKRLRRERLSFMRRDGKPLKDSEQLQHLVSQHTRLMMLEASS